MEMRRNTAEKQVMEEREGGEEKKEGMEGRKERRVVEGGLDNEDSDERDGEP